MDYGPSIRSFGRDVKCNRNARVSRPWSGWSGDRVSVPEDAIEAVLLAKS
jgi:hypothetical protein